MKKRIHLADIKEISLKREFIFENEKSMSFSRNRTADLK